MPARDRFYAASRSTCGRGYCGPAYLVHATSIEPRKEGSESAAVSRQPSCALGESGTPVIKPLSHQTNTGAIRELRDIALIETARKYSTSRKQMSELGNPPGVIPRSDNIYRDCAVFR